MTDDAVELNITSTCSDCGGAGGWTWGTWRICPTCNGTGEVKAPRAVTNTSETTDGE